MGDLEGAVRAALVLPHTLTICLTGRNQQLKEDLEARFAGNMAVTVLGFTSRMNELIAACDTVVHAMGGITYLEAVVRGRPVIAYRPPAGHPAVIAEVLAERGLQRTANTPAELREALLAAFSQPQADGAEASAASPGIGAPSAASAILGAVPRVKPRPTWQTWGLRVGAVAALVMLMAGYTFLGDEPFPVMARALHLKSVSVGSSPAAVTLVVRTDPDHPTPGPFSAGRLR